MLFEMLSGQRLFGGGTTADLLAKVLERNPDWSALPARTPGGVRELLRGCLQKDQNRRLGQIGEARRLLEAPTARSWVPTRLQLIISVFVFALVFGFYWAFWRGTESIQSLAVLPLVNTSGAEDSVYLSEGITESLITDLSRVSDLKVLSRNSVSRFADPGTDARVAGRELNVDAVLTGRLGQREEAVTVSAELIRTSDGALLWRDQYQQSGENVLEIQRRIVRAVTGELGFEVSISDESRKPTASTASPEAYRLYLQGRYFWNTRTEENLRKSADFFQRSVDLDPDYALAWSGMADSYLMLGGWSVLEPKEAYPRASAAAVRAIELDANLAEPHATLGCYKTFYDRDWSGADREFRRAIELNPNYATAHHWYALYFATIGDAGKAIEEIERARECDPLSPVINAEVSYIYVLARKFEKALEETRKGLDLGIPYHRGELYLARVLALLGRKEEAAQKLQGSPKGSGPLGSMAPLYALLGDQASAQTELEALVDLSRQRYVMPAALAQSYAAVRDKERALEYFERSVEDHSLVAAWLREPELDWLRPEPRFRALFERMGLNP
jgi:TolB-like protein/Tfp pilus assembly protein PilF